eukprot:351955-Chlamydomonas_euryale.AAC.11
MLCDSWRTRTASTLTSSALSDARLPSSSLPSSNLPAAGRSRLSSWPSKPPPSSSLDGLVASSDITPPPSIMRDAITAFDMRSLLHPSSLRSASSLG